MAHRTQTSREAIPAQPPPGTPINTEPMTTEPASRSTKRPGDPPREPMAICLCTYNRSEKVLPTLHALVAQTGLGTAITRLLILDNNSRDDTRDVINAFIKQHPGAPIELIVEEEPGKSQSIRRAFAESEEPILSIIDDDCIPEPDWAMALLDAIRAEPRAGIVGGRVDVLLETNRAGQTPPRVATRYISTFGQQHLGPGRRQLTSVEDFLGGASQAIRRQAMLDSGWLAHGRMTCLRGAELSGGEDVELCYMVKASGWQLWYEPSAVMQHVIPPARQTLGEIARLRQSMATTEPMLKWLAHDKPDAAWVHAHLAKATRRYRKTLFLEWRPIRRTIRLAERRGRRQGWALVAEQLKSP
jgi:GT2 family glycosyltransferase